jgi:hypothetical protein
LADLNDAEICYQPPTARTPMIGTRETRCCDQNRVQTIQDTVGMVLKPGSAAEVCILASFGGTVSGYFDNFEDMGAARSIRVAAATIILVAWSGGIPGQRSGTGLRIFWRAGGSRP